MLNHSMQELKLAKSILENLQDEEPSQAAIREVISLCYYAVFHAFTQESAVTLYNLSEQDNRQHLVARFFNHSDMMIAAKAILHKLSNPSLTSKVDVFYDSSQTFSNTQLLSLGFIELQSKRHSADYDFSMEYSIQEAEDSLNQCADMLEAWEAMKKTDEAFSFLLALLHYKSARI